MFAVFDVMCSVNKDKSWMFTSSAWREDFLPDAYQLNRSAGTAKIPVRRSRNKNGCSCGCVTRDSASQSVLLHRHMRSVHRRPAAALLVFLSGAAEVRTVPPKLVETEPMRPTRTGESVAFCNSFLGN
jgi:hypothetical protein